MPKRVAVVGATGARGSSVVQTILKSAHRDEWTIRALSRNTEGAAAKDQEKAGVEVVAADLTDLESLKAAFSDCYAVFAMTDFFVPFANFDADADKAIALERQLAANIYDAVKANPSIVHFIWSTLPHAEKISQGKYKVPHFVAKNGLDDRIKADPELLAKTTFLWVGWYAANFQYPIFKPTMMVSILFRSEDIFSP